jgi:hypothetical protein
MQVTLGKKNFCSKEIMEKCYRKWPLPLGEKFEAQKTAAASFCVWRGALDVM